MGFFDVDNTIDKVNEIDDLKAKLKNPSDPDSEKILIEYLDIVGTKISDKRFKKSDNGVVLCGCEIELLLINWIKGKWIVHKFINSSISENFDEKYGCRDVYEINDNVQIFLSKVFSINFDLVYV